MAWLALVERELLLFASVFFLFGALDELAIDASWLWLRLTRRVRSWRVSREDLRERQLSGGAAVMIPAWQEDRVIGGTIAHALAAWPQADLRIYVGCYRNDPRTAAAVMAGAGTDPRVRLVVHDRAGPSTKADCLNRLYAALQADEARMGRDFRMIVLHDAEDLVDPAALGLLDRAMDDADFAQLPVLPMPQPGSRWIGSHYCEEFAEAHGKNMVVRDAFGAGLPAAGVGCAFSRAMLGQIAQMRGGGPFAIDSLTEDYELGLGIKANGGRSRFLRVRGQDGQLVATRACFPDRLEAAVRQKARWVHGIALQGWDRIGWAAGPVECWMYLRDRRGPINALVLLAAYLLLLVSGVLVLAGAAGQVTQPMQDDPVLSAALLVNLGSFAWRAVMRFAFTTREFGWREGLRAILRIPMANIIAIMAGRRAVIAYIRTLLGAAPVWDKTAHRAHAPSVLLVQPVRAAA